MPLMPAEDGRVPRVPCLTREHLFIYLVIQQIFIIYYVLSRGPRPGEIVEKKGSLVELQSGRGDEC